MQFAPIKKSAVFPNVVRLTILPHVTTLSFIVRMYDDVQKKSFVSDTSLLWVVPLSSFFFSKGHERKLISAERRPSGFAKFKNVS